MARRCVRCAEATIIFADAAIRPTARFMLRHPARIIALGGGAGLAPIAPGTAGTLLAFPIYWGLAAICAPATLLGLIALGFGLGIWACEHTGRALGVADHGAMVWDEVVAFALVLFFTPAGYLWQAGAFLLFRLFDIVKPAPIRYFDRKLKSGFGVMFDDALAAFYTLLVLAVARLLIAG